MRKLLCLLSLIAVSISLSANADVGRIIVFGDSYSDGGNHPTSRHAAVPVGLCSHGGRDTNGLTMVENTATTLGLYTTSTFFNYAKSGATTQGVLDIQLPSMLNEITPLENDLVIIAVGANDIAEAIKQPEDWLQDKLDENGNPIHSDDSQSISNTIRENILSITTQLKDAGFNNIIVSNFKDFTKLPIFNDDFFAADYPRFSGAKLSAEYIINDYNLALDTFVANIQSTSLAGVNLKVFDAHTFSEWYIGAQPSADYFATLTGRTPKPIFETEDYVYHYCEDIVSQSNVTPYGDWAMFDNYLYFDSVHMAKGAHLFNSIHLSNLIKQHY